MQKGISIAYLTMKGGVGKTTLAANITRAMADDVRNAGKKFLLVDADAQCNLSQIFLSSEHIENSSTRSIYQAFDAGHRLYGPSDLKTQIYQNHDNRTSIDLIVGSFETFGLAFATPAKRAAAEQVFQKFVEGARAEYDVISIDTNPSASFTTLQALEAAEFLIAPITFDRFAMRGVDLIVRTLKQRYKWLNNPRCIRLVPNKVRRASSDSERLRQQQEEDEIKRRFPNLEESVLLSRVHETRFLDNRISHRGDGFLVDQKIFAMHRSAHQEVIDDFKRVATAIDVALAEAFGNETKNQSTVIQTVRERVSGFLGGAPSRH